MSRPFASTLALRSLSLTTSTTFPLAIGRSFAALYAFNYQLKPDLLLFDES
jgi:hypothetical protein